MQVWNVLHAARCKCRTPKSRQKSPSGHHSTTLSGYIFATKACIDNRKKNFLSSNISPTCPHNMVNFGLLAAEIVSLVWGTPGNFNGFRVLAALLHGISVVGVSQSLRRWTEGATYIRQDGHHVGHWPTFLVCSCNGRCCCWFQNICGSLVPDETAEISTWHPSLSHQNRELWVYTTSFLGYVCLFSCELFYTRSP